MDDLASIVQAPHPPLTKPNDPGHHCEAEDHTLEQGEDADGVHVSADQEIQSENPGLKSFCTLLLVQNSSYCLEF